MKNPFLSIAPLGLGLFFGIAPVSQAAVLANYTFDNASTTVASNISSDTDLTSSASAFTITNGGTPNDGAAISASTDMAFFRSNGLTTSETGAIGTPDYFTFTFTPNVGTSYNLSSITFDFGGSNGGDTGGAGGTPSLDYTAFGVLRSSAEATDYSTNLGTFSQLVPGPGTGNTYNLNGNTVTLSGPEFSNVTGPITFRFYLYSSDNTFDNQILRMDNVVLNGTVVPEPSAMVLVVAGLGSGLCFRRRSRS